MKIASLLAGLSFAALTMTASVVISAPAQAQRWEDCRERIHQAEWRLDRAIEHYGRHSREAREARYDLERTRDWCYSHHRSDWDSDWHGGPRHHDGWGH